MMAATAIETRTLVDELLAEQRTLTAVERFARYHGDHSHNAKQSLYRALMPARSPNPGEQYAFSVDLDACSGCKSCVAACHSLNGLEEGETWRSVGFLHGGKEEASFQQTVTSACHHCVEPECLNGCPVKAYEKEPLTGIVRHLDDQCIGCQYCVMKCPFEVPKFSANLGIVRKCDLCVNRLGAGEPPACAQACPNGAIKVTIVNQEQVRTQFAGGGTEDTFLDDSPDPAITLPTTRYHSKRELKERLLAADHNAPRLEQPHWPLVVMLVLTQAAAGMFLAATLPGATAATLNLAAFVLLNLGLMAAVLHLGHPLKAWRAFLGWRTSWLSREIIVFLCFVPIAAVATALAWLPFLAETFPSLGASFEHAPKWLPLLVNLQSASTLFAAFAGVGAVFTSAMVYADTKRACWSPKYVFGNFFGTTLTLGAVFGAVTFAALQNWNLERWLLLAAVLVRTAHFVWQRLDLRAALADTGHAIHFNARTIDELLPGSALALTALFVAFIVLGLLAVANTSHRAVFWPSAMALTALTSEITARHLFFAAGGAKRMPGGVPA
jgi:Fe-S-cluster-containing dehydrogenase component/DMSO reductase anchor subunit